MPASYTPFIMDDGPSLPKPLMTGHNGSSSRRPSPGPSLVPRSPISSTPPPPARGPLRSGLHEVAFALLCCQAQFMSLAALFQTVAPWLILAKFWNIEDYGILSWFTAAYSLAVGSFMLPAGRLGDLYGHKRIFMLGWIWLASWSLAAGFCGPDQLILFSVVRALQGIGPALCIPNAMALIGRTLPVGKKRSLALAAFGGMGPLGASTGGFFSALLAETVGWHWEFYVLACWCIVLAVASWYIVPDPSPPPGATGEAKGKAPLMRTDVEAAVAADEYMRDKQRQFEQEQQDEHPKPKMTQAYEQELQAHRHSRRVSSSTVASAPRPLSVFIGGQSYVAFPAVEQENPAPASPVLLARHVPFAPSLDRLPSPPPPAAPQPMSPHPPAAPAPPPRITFDWGGAVTGVLGLILVNFAINEAPLSGWGQAFIVGPLLIGVLSLALFAYIELQPGTKHPLVPLRDLNLTTLFVLSCIFVGWSSHGIWIYYLYIWLEHFRDLSAVVSAAMIFPVAITGTIFALSVPSLLRRINVSIVMFAAMSFFLLGSLLIAVMPVQQTYWINTFISVLIMPGAMNLSFPAATILLSTTLPPEKQGIAASLVATMVNYSISCGLGLAGSIGQQVSANEAATLGLNSQLPPLSVSNPELVQVRLAGVRASLWFAVALGGLGMLIAAIFFHISRVEQARKQSAAKITEEGRQQDEAERKGLLGTNSVPLSNASYQYVRRDSVIAGIGATSGLPKTFSMGGTTVMSLGSNGAYYMKDMSAESDADNTTLHEGL